MYLKSLVPIFLCIGIAAVRVPQKMIDVPPPTGGKASGPIGDDVVRKLTGQGDNKKKNLMDIVFAINQKGKSVTKFSVGSRAKLEKDRNGGIFEGDIMMSRQTQKQLDNMKYEAKTGDKKFDAIKDGAWPEAIIPWTYRGNEHLEIGNQVNAAITHIREKTDGCIRWKWYPLATLRARKIKKFVKIFRGSGCYSMIGIQKWSQDGQDLSIGYGCQYKGIIVHEMVHAMGFFHEQSRLDRDQYIRINWGYINPAMRYNFQKYKPKQASTLGFGYDKQSIMHYGSFSFTTQYGKKTIVSKSDPNEKLGQREGLSKIDVGQLKAYYKCDKLTKKTGNPCKPNPCKNKGTCTKSGRRFTCRCTSGFSGSTCGDVNGGWGKWKTVARRYCGASKKEERRTCSNPAPAGKGLQCLNKKRQRKMSEYKCTTVNRNGGWGKWKLVPRSQSCRRGEKHMTRNCDTPKKSGTGNECRAENGQYRRKEDKCVKAAEKDKDGGWGIWRLVSRTSRSCVKGEKLVRRRCDKPVPSGRGRQCKTREGQYRRTEDRCVGDCNDNFPFCKDIASFCTNTKIKAGWMNLNCKKSCKKCGGNCKDVNSNSCPTWAKKRGLNYCVGTYANYMKKNCKKSCGHC